MNWDDPYSPPDPGRYLPPLVTGVILPDDHEAKHRRQRKKAKKTEAAKRKAAAKADARGWKSVGGGVQRRTVKLPRRGR